MRNVIEVKMIVKIRFMIMLVEMIVICCGIDFVW